MTEPTGENTPLKMPEIPISGLPTTTKDFLLSHHAATGHPIAAIITEILNAAAAASEGGAKR